MTRQNWLEWLALGVSAVAVAGVIGFLAVDAIFDDGRPPIPEVELHTEAAYEAPAGWLIPATVRNGGDRAAEAVVLRASAEVGGTTEESELTVDYLPSGSEAQVTFGFSGEPDGEVSVGVVGFRLP
ncbi:MAG TPA: hypothetical protein VM253_07670 [Candidatus Limnocylindrales bacterium]|nr:hypothetical protein [Candidatus Limnocylindrales bacterium]